MIINNWINTILLKGGNKYMTEPNIYGGGTAESRSAMDDQEINSNDEETAVDTENSMVISQLPEDGRDEDSSREEENITPSLEKIAMLEDILSSYKNLINDVSDSKEKIIRLRETSKQLVDEKEKLKIEIENITPTDPNIKENEDSHTRDEEQLEQGISDEKKAIKAKSCVTVIENVKHIQENIATNSEKAESYLEPLSLSCKLLKTQVKYTRSLEHTLKEIKRQRELRLQYEESNEAIDMLALSLGIKEETKTLA